MELEEIYKRIDEVGKQELEANKEARRAGEKAENKMVVTETDKPPFKLQTVDVYEKQRARNKKQNSKGEKHGSDPMVNILVESVLQILIPQYRKTKGMMSHLRESGQLDKADAVRNQYMMDYYLPGVESIILQSSPDDLLNNKETMDLLDNYSLTVGDAKGYLESYLRTAYGDMLGQGQNGSDEMVSYAIKQLQLLGAEGEVRAAISLAKRTQKDIDSGKNAASQDDYEFILKVANA